MSRSHSLSLAALSPCPSVSGAVNPARPSHQAQSTMTAVLRDSGIRTGSRRPRLVRGMAVAAGCAPRAFGADSGARAAPAQHRGAGAKQPRPSPSPQGAPEKGTARLGWHSPKPAAAQTCSHVSEPHRENPEQLQPDTGLALPPHAASKLLMK